MKTETVSVIMIVIIICFIGLLLLFEVFVNKPYKERLEAEKEVCNQMSECDMYRCHSQLDIYSSNKINNLLLMEQNCLLRKDVSSGGKKE